MNITYINEKLQKNLSNKRYEHSFHTAKEAKKLSLIYDVNQEKAYMAGLLHDCAKELTLPMLQQLLIEKDYSDDFLQNRTLMHAPAGARLASIEYGISDEEILQAIHYHCYGRENMTMLEKIIFVADKIEMTRQYDYIEKYREMAYQDMDRTIYMFLDFTVKHVTSKKYYLYKRTVEAYKYYRNVIENKVHI